MTSLLNDRGVSIYYEDYNPEVARSVLLIHGLGATGESWNLQIPALIQAGYRVIVPDVYGFGKSANQYITSSIIELVDDLVQLIQSLIINKIHVIGISMGGIMALQLVIDHPHLVDKLIIINTFARLRHKGIRSWLYYIWRFSLINILGLRTQAKVVAKKLFPEQNQLPFREILINQIIQANPKAYRTTMVNLARFNVSNRLGDIQRPTLIIVGDKDTTVPPTLQFELAHDIPNSKCVIIKGAGHAVTAEKPDEINQHIIDFLSQTLY